MNFKRLVLAFAAIFGFWGSAHAAGECPAGHICASDPNGVAEALQELGFKAELKTHEKSGDPMINSAAAGYKFALHFNDCEQSKACKSLSFVLIFKDDGKNTAQLANAWNRKKRFTQMAANTNGSLAVSYDVTTLGGLTPANFADVVDWWQSMLGQLPRFFEEQSSQQAG